VFKQLLLLLLAPLQGQQLLLAVSFIFLLLFRPPAATSPHLKTLSYTWSINLPNLILNRNPLSLRLPHSMNLCMLMEPRVTVTDHHLLLVLLVLLLLLLLLLLHLLLLPLYTLQSQKQLLGCWD
jgi:hypothetical protein